MSAQILELRLPPGTQEEIAGEYELRPGLTPEAAASQLPLTVRRHLSPVAAAFEALHRGLSENLEMTGIRRIRLLTPPPGKNPGTGAPPAPVYRRDHGPS
jgi:hypothetical protein